MKPSETIPSPERRSSRLATKMKNTPPSMPLAKKRKKKLKTDFLSLNNDTLDEICEWLPLKSLAAFGMTCKRINQVASNYFRRKHPANYVLLSSSNGKVQLHPKEQYVQCFSEQFHNIVFHGAEKNVLQYAATTFKKIPLRRIGFFAADYLTEAHAKCIDGIIKKADIIEFTRCSSTGGLYEILKHCSNMKHLALKSFTECKTHGHKHEWMLQQYPTLKHLHWDLCGKLPVELINFFKNNPNVDSFYGTQAILPFIRDHNIMLKTLVVKVSADSTETVFDQLRDLCDQNAVQSLFLMGDLKQVNSNLPMLNKLTGIYAIDMTTATILQSFSHIKLINTTITALTQATQLAHGLVNLEEAYLDVTFIDSIMPFIRFAPKLTKIFINNTASMRPGSKLSLSKLEKQRNKLANATKLTVYLKEGAYLKIKNMSIGSNCSTVQIKPIEAHITNNVFIRTILDI
ncbi:uncharacterized protein LOC129568498 [Sitodiplosis mosellana]|uniref:uncharacterized protein LOC129568498 n=1 Tax=Sitodiplosis mosellana TaxID=263140 RepID=UPI00244376B1|nr:uncharacterized protein LOC129568498 [Sitodiplosis mosellana]